MKKSLITLLCCITFSANCQLPTKVWDKRFGGGDNNSNLVDFAKYVINTSDGGYILGGASNAPLSFEKSANSNGDFDFWIVKVDVNGVKVWDKTFGGSDRDELNCLLLATDGSFLLGGFSKSAVGFDKTESNRGDRDFWVIKVDVNGNKIWDKTFGGSGVEECNSILELPNGDFILGGYSSSGIGGDKTEISRGGADFWIVKIDSNGNKIFDKSFGGNATDISNKMISTSNGFLLFGYTSSTISGEVTVTDRGLQDYWVVKMDINGNKIWDKRYGGTGNDLSGSIVSDNNGNFLITGTSNSGIGFDKTDNTRGDFDMWVIKIDATGNKIWDKTFGGNNFDNSGAISNAYNTGFIIAGQSRSNSGFDVTEPSKSSNITYADFWLVKIDDSGNKIWDKRYGGDGPDEAYSIVKDGTGSFVLNGLSSSNISGDKTQNHHGGYDYWSLKFSECGTLSLSASSNTTICQGNSIVLSASGCFGSLNWSSGQTTTGITISPNITTTYTATCIAAGCSYLPQSLTVNVIPFAPPTITANPHGSPICMGIPVTLNSSCSGATLLWNTGATTNSIIVNPTSLSTTYTANCTNSCGTSANGSKTINRKLLPSPPELSLSGTESLCPNSTISLTATECTGTILWSNGVTGVISSTITINATGTFSASCLNNGCSSSSSTSLVVIPAALNLNLTGLSTNGTIHAALSITSGQTIGNQINTTYKAGKNIALNQSFNVQQGGIFQTQIGSICQITEGLRLYLPFNETITDFSIYNRVGSIRGQGLYATGHKAGAFNFNGSTRIEFGNFFSFSELTVSVWLKANPSQVTNATIIDNNNRSSTSWDIRQNNNSTNNCVFNSSSNVTPSSLNGLISANQWTHFVIVKSGTTLSYYKDGIFQNSTPVFGIIPYDASRFLCIGAWFNNGSPQDYWVGYMDELKIFDRALSAIEVGYLFSE